MERRLGIALALLAFIVIAVAKPDAKPVHATDAQLEQQAAHNLAAICSLKPEKC